MFASIIGTLSNWMYTYILIVLLIASGLYFSFRTKFVQFRLLGESMRAIREPKESQDKNAISSFEALMVSTASRVGVGNIAGVSNAICLGGPGAVFWMWLIALIGSASAFIESTLAQIYKKRDDDGSSFGGPAYYIEAVLNSRGLGLLFSFLLIFTYMGGFNMVASFNIVTAFTSYSFYDASQTPMIIGAVLAVAFALCIFGGGSRLSKITGLLVPVMAIIYIGMALLIVLLHITLLPGVIMSIFADAFNFRAIFGGFVGSCVMQGIKRGLYSNEAGVGSAPNAAASASVSHPVKQGLVQMLSVYIDTIVICTATAFMLLCSGVSPDASITGMPYVQAAVSNSFGGFGNVFVTFSLFCFAFTTLLGNFYYAEANLKYINKKSPSKAVLLTFRLVAALIVFLGSQMEFSLAWDTADVLMGFMALMNLPVIIILAQPAIDCMNDYMKQRREGKNPVFLSRSISLKQKTDFWN